MLLPVPACTLTGPWALIRRRRRAGALPEKSRTKRSPWRTKPLGCGRAATGSSRRIASILKSAGRRIHVPERLFEFEAHRIVVFLLYQTLHHPYHIVVVVAVGYQEIDHQHAHGHIIVREEHAAQSLADLGIGGERFETFQRLEPYAGVGILRHPVEEGGAHFAGARLAAQQIH